MGVSTDGLLAYGYIWSDEYNLFAAIDTDENEDLPEWPELVAVSRGHTNPWALREEDPIMSFDQWTTTHRAELDTWSATKADIEAEFGVEIEYHGSDEWAVPIVCLKAQTMRAARGSPHRLDAGDLVTDASWDQQLQHFIETLSIDISEAEGPAWWLASWWG